VALTQGDSKQQKQTALRCCAGTGIISQNRFLIPTLTHFQPGA